MIMRNLGLSAPVAALFAVPGLALAEPSVVVSIKPVHSLVASIMQGVGEPELIVKGAASPHTYTLRPSDARALENAAVVFWVGHGLEAFLEKPLEALPKNAVVVALEDAPGLVKLPFREGGAFGGHDHEDDGHTGHDHDDHQKVEATDAHHDHEHGGTDMHMWLDPTNAMAMARQIKQTLIKVDPENTATYEANTAALLQAIDALDAEVAATLKPVQERPFIVFHDAYQYFETRYDVRVAGSITVSPETMPGA
eukprot:gene55697-76334_t